MTPVRSSIELMIVNEINRLILQRGVTKQWLADITGIEYSKVKRLLRHNGQPLLLTEANDMLIALGSSLADVITHGLLQSLRNDLDKYDRAA